MTDDKDKLEVEEPVSPGGKGKKGKKSKKDKKDKLDLDKDKNDLDKKDNNDLEEPVSPGGKGKKGEKDKKDKKDKEKKGFLGRKRKDSKNRQSGSEPSSPTIPPPDVHIEPPTPDGTQKVNLCQISAWKQV